jgi:glutaminase
LPSDDVVRALVTEAHEKFKSNTAGQNAQVYPALARVPRDLFGICVVGTTGRLVEVGDSQHEFTIMSVSKPFVFALVTQLIGPDEVREKIGVNATGRAFNSLEGIERGDRGRTNPMVNAGAIATTSLVPGATLDDKWRFIQEGLSRCWLYEIGLPGKSGIGGGIATVSPGKGGLGSFAPPLDKAGNSVKGQLVAKFLSQRLGMDLFLSKPETDATKSAAK